MYRLSEIEPEDKFWFYLRKAFFQGLLPIILKLVTIFDYINVNDSPVYHRAYFYTSVLLGIYACFSILCDLIFSMTAVNVNFKKEIDLQDTSPEMAFSLYQEHGPVTNPENYQTHITINRRMFKFRFAAWTSIQVLAGLCWTLGVDCPIIIPIEEGRQWLPPDLYNSVVQQSQMYLPL